MLASIEGFYFSCNCRQHISFAGFGQIIQYCKIQIKLKIESRLICLSTAAVGCIFYLCVIYSASMKGELCMHCLSECLLLITVCMSEV